MAKSRLFGKDIRDFTAFYPVKKEKKKTCTELELSRNRGVFVGFGVFLI